MWLRGAFIVTNGWLLQPNYEFRMQNVIVSAQTLLIHGCPLLFSVFRYTRLLYRHVGTYCGMKIRSKWLSLTGDLITAAGTFIRAIT